MNVQRLWAPWRLAYIRSIGKTTRGCFICRGARSSDDDKNLVVARTRLSIAILNRFPYNSGHVMVAPRAHKGGFDALTDDEMLDIFRQTRAMITLLKQVYNPEGFNVGVNLGSVAGTSLPSHLHVHIVPRWNGDVNFMPMIADTKVVPELLGQTLKKLKKQIRVNQRAINADNRKGVRRG